MFSYAPKIYQWLMRRHILTLYRNLRLLDAKIRSGLSTRDLTALKTEVSDIEQAVAAFAGSPNGGLVITANGSAVAHRDLIIALAARHKLPAVYWQRHFVAAGGLVSYGDDGTHQYHQAAGYVDRILKGEKPGDLPVQAPTKYETVINLKTAKALGLTVPSAMLARADEVIE